MRRLLLVVLLRIRAGILVLIVLLIVLDTHSTTITSVVRLVAILMQNLTKLQDIGTTCVCLYTSIHVGVHMCIYIYIYMCVYTYIGRCTYE